MRFSWRSSLRRLWLPAVTGVVLLGIWFGGLAWSTDAGIRTFEARTVSDYTRPADPQPWRAVRFFAEPDSYCWLTYARDLRASNRWRLRFTRADNAPAGREMHWSHLPLWSLAGLSAAWETGGAPPPLALELAGRSLMPLFGWLFFSAFFLLLGPRLGWRLATLVTAVMVTALHWNYHTLRPDHHGFQLAASIGMWLGLLLGGMGGIRSGTPPRRRRPPGRRNRARRWMIFSGLCGGIGLWLGATVFWFSLAASAAGAAAALLLLPPPAPREGWEIRPGLWRWWGAAGALSALAFYTLEYAPRHMGMRLEVNHPLHALGWLGIAEGLYALAFWRTQGRLSMRQAVPAALGLAAAALVPLLVVFGPVDWFWPRTPIMLRLHARHIIEFRTLFATAGTRWPRQFLMTFGVIVPALIWTAVLLARRRLTPATRIVLLPMAVVTTLFLLLYAWQIRWESFALSAGLLLTGFLLAGRRDPGGTSPPGPLSRRLPVLLLLLLAGQAAYGTFRIAAPLRQLHRVEKMDALWLKALLQRNLLLRFKARFPESPCRIALPAEMSPAVTYFGVGDTLGSLYWENPDGLTALAAFFGDPLPGPHARRIARERGITHVLMPQGVDDALLFYHLATGRADQSGASRTVGGATARAGTRIPSWLRPLPDLDAATSPVGYVQVPAIGQWVPLPLPVSHFQVIAP